MRFPTTAAWTWVVLGLAGCGSSSGSETDAAVDFDAGDPMAAEVHVRQTWRGYFVTDGVEDEATTSTSDAPYDLPPADATRWGAAYFEHERYECARDGLQSFILLNPPGAVWDEPRDLFVYMHGGGLGAFDPEGTYHPAYLSQRDCRSMVDQEDAGRLLARWSGDPCSGEWPPQTGLASLIVEAAEMRVLIVSKCDQDAYSGVGLPDPNNTWNPDNRVDGLLATVAAIEAALGLGSDASSSIVLAGASAGGVGAHTVARALAEAGRPAAAVVSDAAVMGDAFDSIYETAPEGCVFREQVASPADWRPRLGVHATSAPTAPRLDRGSVPAQKRSHVNFLGDGELARGQQRAFMRSIRVHAVYPHALRSGSVSRRQGPPERRRGGSLSPLRLDHSKPAVEAGPAKDKIVSIFEPHTDIIIKDRRDVLYGHKLCLATGASGLILDCRIEDGNPADATLAIEMVERQHDIFGRVPRQAAFDGGFASKANLAQLIATARPKSASRSASQSAFDAATTAAAKSL